MSNVRFLSKSKVKILPGKKYDIKLNRKDYAYYQKVLEYADRLTRLADVNYPVSFNLSVDRYTGKVKRYKSPWLFFGQIYKNQVK